MQGSVNTALEEDVHSFRNLGLPRYLSKHTINYETLEWLHISASKKPSSGHP
jgi:hypothetical protein